MTKLRPVEKLYILSLRNKERWSTTSAVAATLAYLYYCGYLLYERGAFRLSQAAESALENRTVIESGILRPYEVDMLKAVANNDSAGVTTSVWSFDLLNRSWLAWDFIK